MSGEGMESCAWVWISRLDKPDQVAFRPAGDAPTMKRRWMSEPLVRLSDAEARIREMDDQLAQAAMLAISAHARATASEAREAALREAVGSVVEIVEGMKGSMEHGVWRDDTGLRLKDTGEWAALYVACPRLNKDETK